MSGTTLVRTTGAATVPDKANGPLRADELRVLLWSDPKGVVDSPASRRAIVSIHVGATVEVGCRRDGRYHRGPSVHGDIDVIPPGTASRWELKEKDTALILRLPGGLLEEAARQAEGDPARVKVVNRFQIRDPQMEHIGWALKAEMEAGYPGGRLCYEALALALAASVVNRHSTKQVAPKQYSYGMPGRRLREVISFIEDNLKRDLRLKEIADVAGLSLSQCKLAFSRAVGKPVHQYVIERRVERAKELLGDDKLTISEVAAETGFTHKSHLAYHLRRHFGMSPAGLRRTLRGI